MEDCCDICGVIGVADALITCTQCKINCEHMEAEILWRGLSAGKWYCMRTLLEGPIDDWRCEECESSSKSRPVSSYLTRELPDTSTLTNTVEVWNDDKLHADNRILLHESRTGSLKGEKKVATSKTKYISVEEAIMLSSAEKKSWAPSNVTYHSKTKHPLPKTWENKLERIPIRGRTESLSFSSRQDLASGTLRQLKPQRLVKMEISERQLQQSKRLSEVQRSASSLQPSQAPMDKHTQKEQPAKVRLPQTNVRHSMKKPSAAPSPNAFPVAISGGNGHTTIEPRTCTAQNVNNNLLPDSKKCSSPPALDALWKGSFSIQDEHRHGELNHQIQAHPPSIVRRKIYEFSKQMPEVLHFQLVPFKKFWINIFQEHIPDGRDIGLYFFPSDGERSEDYISLLESISVKNMALRNQIADVELLVFTSKLLPASCQFWEGKYFLWGVFHRLRRHTSARHDNWGLELSMQPSHDVNHGHNQVGDTEVDMEIDMIGGINVGRIDVPVQMEPLPEKWLSLREESATAMQLPLSDKQINSVSRRPLATIPSLNVKMESHDVFPPGFEEAFRLRVEGSSSSVKNVGAREGKRKEPEDHGCHHSLPAKRTR